MSSRRIGWQPQGRRPWGWPGAPAIRHRQAPQAPLDDATRDSSFCKGRSHRGAYHAPFLPRACPGPMECGAGYAIYVEKIAE